MIDKKPNAISKSKHIYSVDIVRVILSLCIVTFHIFDGLSPYWGINAPGYIAVEAFFILSGYFLVASIYKNDNPPPVHKYIFRKIWFFVPIIVIVFLISLVVFGITSGINHGPWFEALYQPMSLLWYIGFMLIASLILYPIYKHAKNKFAFPAILISIGFYLVFFFTLGYIENLGAETTSKWLNALLFIGRCLMRSIGGEILGGFIFAISTQIKHHNKPSSIIFSILGILTGLGALCILLIFPKSVWDFFVVFLFFIFFLILLTNIGAISKRIILPNKFSQFLSRFSLFLYLTHRICISFLLVFPAISPQLLDQNWWIATYITLGYILPTPLAIGTQKLYELIKAKILVKFKKLNNI